MATTEVTILERILEPEKAELSPEVARYLLTLDFPQADRRRMEELYVRAREGTLTAAEQTDLDHYGHVAQLLDRLRGRARQVMAAQEPPAEVVTRERTFEIPPGIRRSQEALRRDLPELLKNRRLRGQWVAYHGAERIGIASAKVPLIRECLRQGLADDQYYIGWIDPTELIEEEELPPPRPGEIEEDDCVPTP